MEQASRLSNVEEIKLHPFFHDTDWKNILRQKAQFIPELSNEEDTSYFDPRCDRYHHNSSDEESAAVDFRPVNGKGSFNPSVPTCQIWQIFAPKHGLLGPGPT